MKVKFVPYQPHCFAFGGFEIQMLGALDAVIKAGVQAEKIDVWSKDSDFEILHCWGLGFHHYENMRWAKHAKKKIVLTALLSYYENFNERLRHLLSTHIKKAQYYIQIANMADAVVVVNELQAEACRRYFKVPREKIHVIPNIVNSLFFDSPPDTSFVKKFPVSNYVLTVGSVCSRKNQLNLAYACVKGNRNLVIIGRLLEGEESYGEQIDAEIKKNRNITWIRGLSSNSSELVSAYQNCAIVALPSFVEQQPITLLEAVAVQKPLLIADRAYARQKYYRNAMCVSPGSIDAIVDGIRKVTANPLLFTPTKSVLEECREENVGQEYVNVYRRVMGS